MFKHVRNNSGASIIFVVIVAVVFLLAGASVLTAANLMSNTSIKNHTNKQLYYYAKSAADVISQEMVKNDGFAYEIINHIGLLGSTYITSENNVKEEVDVPSEIVFDCGISLFNSGVAYDEVKYDNVKIRLSGIKLIKSQKYQNASGQDYNVVEKYDLEIEKVTISFVTRYRGEEYKLALDYAFSAKGGREAVCQRINSIVNDITDLNLQPLFNKAIDWNEFDRIFVRVHQNEVH